MKKLTKKFRARLGAGLLAGVMLFGSLPLTAMAASGQDDLLHGSIKASAIQLETAPTKMMDYYAAADEPAGIQWVTDADAVSFLPAAATEGDVTCAVKATDGAVWIGTQNGLMRMDLTEKDSRDMVQYFAGNRYMYNGNDNVTGLAADDAGGVWVKNADGCVHIKMVDMTMEERTYFYEKLTNDINDRRGMISSNNGYSYDPTTDEYTQSFVSTSDNDGLWTAMYAMGEILRYQTLKQENADAHEIAAAKKAATRATKAVLLLDYISGRGNGFPCRSYMLTSEAGAQEGANGMQAENGFWFEKRLLNENESYPDPIIDELKQDGKTPIGIATVRITKDSLNKRGSQIFAGDTDYNGLGLSQSSIDTFNTVRSDGDKLGTDIVSGNRNQVFPVMYEGVNVGVQGDTIPGTFDESKVKFRLTAPIYERIPQTFNELFPDSAIGEDGYIDESQIVYKADTSSDEVDGHYALFLTAYRYLCDEAEDAELKELIADTCIRMTDLILEDDHYYIVDATGKATQWSRWLARYFNDGIGVMREQAAWCDTWHAETGDPYRLGLDADGEDILSYGYEDGPLNALEVMSALKIAGYIATEEGETAKAATYNTAYDQCFDANSYDDGGPENADPTNAYTNGKGYIDMALEYIERRVVRQNNDAYCENDNQVVDEYTPGDKIFNNAYHQDWTQYVNYSDEELGWFPVYTLITLEKDKARYDKIVEAFDQWYDGQEEREENPFYTFLYQLAHPEKTDVDLTSAVRYFYRSPLVRNQAMFARGDRQDVFYIEAGNRDKKAQTNYALPLDEMEIGKDNGNPFVRYTGYGQQNTAPYTAASLCDCTVFTLPYWLGRYYGIIKETEGTYFTRVTPTVTLTADGTTLTATVKDGATALNRVIVDFYADGAYIGRVRTDATGKAVFDGSEKLSGGETVTAQTTERLIGTTMYNQTDSNEAAIPDPNKPASIALSVPENCEMVVGDSRSIDFVILPESNKLRAVTWTSSDENVATVDEWGRVTAKAAGTVTITATAKANTAVKDSGTIKVVATLNDLAKTTGKAVVNYEGAAAEEVQNLQKYVDRYTKDEALAAEDTVVPATVKAVLNGGAGSTTAVTEGTATWSLETYGIKRVDTNPAHERDAEQLFMGNRYLPADAAATPNTSVIHMESDNANGLWVASATAVTHIRMEELSYTDKAAEMSETTQENVARRGMVAQSIKNGTAWAPEETDNDGLWTSMYGVGELMRYAVLKEDDSATTEEVAAAKETALSSIKAVLLLSNLTCRTGTVDAYVRPLKNESNQYAFETQFEGIALKKDNQNGFSINNPQSGPVDKTARVDGPELMAPFFPEDWAPVTATSNKADFATRKRTLEGMIARTYRLDGEYPGRDYNDGYYWDIDGDTATCVESTSTKVKWEKLVGQTVDASGEIPEVLADLLGNGITKDNITYKTDTSTDEIIGHLFIYKVAYDILDDNDQEEAAIKEVLVDTVRNIAQHLADNGYCLRDATGQATTWGKTERDYFNNAYAWEDCALNSLVNLCAFKLAGYVTGEARWENEYRMLALDDPYRYADLAGEYWTRWEHLADVDEGLTDPEEVYTWILQNLNYSDEEMAMEAYYLLFQMEDDAELIGKYQDGLNAWWNSMQYSENPLWYYIYQLAYPEAAQQDAYENDLVDTAAWALSRHPIDTIKWSASHADRPDVKQDEELTRDKTTGEIRVVPFDERSVHKYNGSSYKLTDDNINRMEGSTTYTLPYWMGRYHGMITPPTTTP